MPVFTRSTLVSAPAEELYRFHENPHNLRRISPPGLRILEIRAEETANPGAEFNLAVRQGPFTLRWTGRWETTAAPWLLVDLGVKCPFALWRHHHVFEPHPDGTTLTDRVEFRLPWHLGGPIGDLVCRHLVFPRLFAARQAATRAWFRPLPLLKNRWPTPVPYAIVDGIMKSDLRLFAGFLALATTFAVTAVAQDDKPAAKADDTELPDPVAVVEGEKISRADLQQTFNNALAASGISPDDLTADQKMAGYREILDELIVDKLVSRKASSVEVPDADIDAEITRVKGQFPDEAAFKAEMAKAGESDTSFRDTVKKMMQQQKWMEDQIGDQAKVADEDIKKFYDENKKEFEHPELVRASHILIRVPEDASDEVVAEKKAADAALARVSEKKEDFTAVAKEVSEEPGAKESGGDLNFFPKDRMVPEFADAAFAMKKGDISKEPVRTKFGWHIINVTDRKDAGSMPYDEVKEQVGSYLEGSKRRDVVRGIIESVRSEAKVDNKLPAAPSAPAPTAPAGS